MATSTEVDTFKKTDWTAEQVDAERQFRLDAGAVSCTRTEDAENYILTTVWNQL